MYWFETLAAETITIYWSGRCTKITNGNSYIPFYHFYCFVLYWLWFILLLRANASPVYLCVIYVSWKIKAFICGTKKKKKFGFLLQYLKLPLGKIADPVSSSYDTSMLWSDWRSDCCCWYCGDTTSTTRWVTQLRTSEMMVFSGLVLMMSHLFINLSVCIMQFHSVSCLITCEKSSIASLDDLTKQQ